jgi:hypothetical protein
MNKAKKIVSWPCMTAEPPYFCKYFFLKLDTLLGIGLIKDFQGVIANVGSYNRVSFFSGLYESVQIN